MIGHLRSSRTKIGSLGVFVILAASCSGGSPSVEPATTSAAATTPSTTAMPFGDRDLTAECVLSTGLILTAPSGHGFDATTEGDAACRFLLRDVDTTDVFALRIFPFPAGSDWRKAVSSFLPFVGLTTVFDDADLPVLSLDEALAPDVYGASLLSHVELGDGLEAYVTAGQRTTKTSMNPEEVGDPSTSVVVVAPDESGMVVAINYGGAPTFETDLAALRSLLSTLRIAS